MGSIVSATHREPWNKGKIVGHTATFRPLGLATAGGVNVRCTRHSGRRPCAQASAPRH
jgi:hypothetical protein